MGLSFIGYHDGHYEVGAWLLGGLVPLFVGVAQIINAVLSGATFGVPAAQRRFGPTFDAGAPPEHSAGSAVPPGPTYGGVSAGLSRLTFRVLKKKCRRAVAGGINFRIITEYYLQVTKAMAQPAVVRVLTRYPSAVRSYT